MKQISVESRILESATSKIDSKLNLAQYKKEREKAMKHKAICKAVLAFKEEHNYMPMYAILSVGISAGAFKNEEFEKGYTKFDKEKAKAVFDMAVALTKKVGKEEAAPNDVAYRICSKYYKLMSHNVADFEAALAKIGKGKISDSRDEFHKSCKALGM